METTDRMLEKVRKLIAKAESTDSLKEREALIAKAEALMIQHSIDEAMLEMTRPADQRMKPETLEYFQLAEYGTPIRDQVVDLAQWVGNHFGLRMVFFGLNRGKATDAVWATFIGFPSDLRSFQTLFTALHLDLAAQLRPRPDVAKGFDENVYDLHAAGVSWREIVHSMNRGRPENGVGSRAAEWPVLKVATEEEVRASGGRCKTAYRRHCKAIGELPDKIQSPITYQRNFAAAYVRRILSRLIDSKLKAEEETAGSGTALALRTDSIDEMFNEMFGGNLKEAKLKTIRYDGRAQAAGRAAGDKADLGGRERMGKNDRGQLA